MIAELEDWHDFYMLVGTAGATLLALCSSRYRSAPAF